MKYLYEDAEFWLQYLNPSEIAYLILYAYNRSNGKEALFVVDVLDGNSFTPEESAGEFTVELGVPDSEFRIYIDGTYSVEFLGGDPGDYNNPPESMDITLDETTVTSILCNTHEEDDISIDASQISKDSPGFNLVQITYLGEECLSYFIKSDRFSYDKGMSKILSKDIPEELQKKIDIVRAGNKDVIRAHATGKKYKI